MTAIHEALFLIRSRGWSATDLGVPQADIEAWQAHHEREAQAIFHARSSDGLSLGTAPAAMAPELAEELLGLARELLELLDSDPVRRGPWNAAPLAETLSMVASWAPGLIKVDQLLVDLPTWEERAAGTTPKDPREWALHQAFGPEPTFHQRIPTDTGFTGDSQ